MGTSETRPQGAADGLRLARALVDEVRLLPDEERAELLQGARVRRDALALARAQGGSASEGDVRAEVARFRRARGLLRADDFEAWMRDRGTTLADLSRWIHDELLVQSVRLSAAPLAPRDIADFARVAEGTDGLWRRARRVCDASASDRGEDECIDRYFDSLGRPRPDDLAGWSAAAGFDELSAALAAVKRHVDEESPATRRGLCAAGDPAPSVTLWHRETGAMRLPDLAGTPAVLCLASSAERGAELRERWDGYELTAMVVCASEGRDGARVPWMVDRGAALWRAVGVDPSQDAYVVLDRGARVAWIGGDERAARREGSLRASGATLGGAMAPVAVVPDVFDAAECASLIARWDAGGHRLGAVTALGERGARTYADGAIKRREDHLVTDPALDGWIMDRLQRRVGPELLRAFHFRVSAHEPFRVACYDAERGGLFHPHRDDENPAVGDRRFALSLNLNAGDYEGASLCFPEYGVELSAPRGAAVVYSASLLHGVREVTRGRRFALVGFFQGVFRGG